MIPKHPAPFSPEILPVIASYLRDGDDVVDTFGGIGRIHDIVEYVAVRTFAVELEPEWAAAHPRTWVGDALHLPEHWAGRWNAVATSVTYANRFADSHNAQERCRACRGTGLADALDRVPCAKCDGKGIRNHHRISYTHNLGRKLTDGNSGSMQWGDRYREFHEAWLREVWRILVAGTEDDRASAGRLVLNISDHMRDHARQPVVRWFIDAAIDVGFEWIGATPVPTKRMKKGANGEARVPYEMVLCFEKVVAA